MINLHKFFFAIILSWSTNICICKKSKIHKQSIKLDKKVSIEVIHNDTVNIDKRVSKLQALGKDLLIQKKYDKAFPYYLAVLQLLEGVGGTECQDIRFNCTLTLAQCDIKNGDYYDAISRCTEVIDELPIPYPPPTKIDKYNLNEIQIQLLGKSYYRRGLAFMKLGLSHLAIIDMKSAQIMMPTDSKVKQQLDILYKDDNHSISISIPNKQNNTSSSTSSVSSSSSSPASPSSSSAESTSMSTQSTTLEEQFNTVHEEFQNIIDYSQKMTAHHYYSKKDIDRLLYPHKYKQQSLKATPSTPSIFSSFGGGSPLGALGGGGGMGGLSGALGGLGGLSGLLGGMGGGGKSPLGGLLDFSQIEMMSPLIQQFLGIDKNTMDNILNIGKAVVSVYQVFKRYYMFILKYSGFVMCLFWIMVSVTMK